MRWTKHEKRVLDQIISTLQLHSLESPRKIYPGGISRQPYGPRTDSILAAYDRVSQFRFQSLEPEEPTEKQIGQKDLASFAHYIGVDPKEDFWEFKCLFVALFEHPYFGGEDKTVRQSRKRAMADADLHEWWIEADWLRAKLEHLRGRTINDDELAAEMALRSRGWKDVGKLDMAEYDTFVEVQEHYRLELARKRKEVESLYIRQKFDIPSMRAHARKNAPGQRPPAQTKWELSETEKDRPKCLPIYQRLRTERVEKARQRASRSR